MKKGFGKGFILLFSAFFLLLFYVWLQVASERLAYKIDMLRIKLDSEMETNRQLKIFVNELSSPERLHRIANKMKLQIPSKSQVIEVTVYE